jgi:uncharacterized protein YecA (UPF0149 family)
MIYPFLPDMKEYEDISRLEVKLKHGPHPRKVRGYRLPDDPNKGIGRNDPCLCGSSKKFKKCHIKPWNK